MAETRHAHSGPPNGRLDAYRIRHGSHTSASGGDWRQFEREKDILPNLKWMPSTSVHPGADHRIFWGTIRPVDDPFWNEHRPGDRWNCKCTLSSTDEAPTAVPGSGPDNKPQPGLETIRERTQNFSRTNTRIRRMRTGEQRRQWTDWHSVSRK